MRNEMAYAVTSRRIQVVFVFFQHGALCHQHYALAERNDIFMVVLIEMLHGKFLL